MDYTLPHVFTLKEVAEYLKIDEQTVLRELEIGKLHGFRLGKEWRCTEDDLFTFIKNSHQRYEVSKVEAMQSQTTRSTTYDVDWNISEIEPFDFHWPKVGGGSNLEHYDKGYEAVIVINTQEYVFRIGFGNRESAGLKRRRVTIWIGNRAIVEFAGSNNYEKDGLLAGIIRLKNGKQLTNPKIPEDYLDFSVEKYNAIIQGPRASTGMAVICHKDDLNCMLKHAVIRAIWKDLVK